MCVPRRSLEVERGCDESQKTCYPMEPEFTPTRFPKVPIWRRGAAFAIDFVAVLLISLPFAGWGFVQILVFAAAWLGMRVVYATSNHGQTLGRWALDMKVIDAKYHRIPGILELTKREGITLLGAILILFGLGAALQNLFFAFLLGIPLGADFSLAWADPERQQAFHDNVGRTMVVQSRRGYSLDLRVKKLVALLQQRMKQ